MEILVTVALVVALRLAVPLVGFVRSRPALAERFVRRYAPPAPAAAEPSIPTIVLDDDRPEVAEPTVQWGLFTEAFVQARLAALGRELERLDDDPDLFARAFHTTVVRSAYDALLSDAARFADQARRPSGPVLTLGSLGPSSGSREELWL